MRKFSIVFMMLTFVLALGVFPAESGERGGHRGGKGGMMKALDLDKDQLAKMRELRSGMKRKKIEQRAKVDLARLDFQEELQKDKLDTAKINKLIDKIAEAKAEQTRAKLSMRVEMIKILTPEQKQKMLERMGDKMFGSGKGKGHGKKKGERQGGY